jgi:hypothetical protein
VARARVQARDGATRMHVSRLDFGVRPTRGAHNHVLGRHVRAARAPGVVPHRMLQEPYHRHRLHPSVGVQPLIVTTTTA